MAKFGCVTRPRGNARIVFGTASPSFSVRREEVIDIEIDLSDEADGSAPASASVTASFIGGSDGSTTTIAAITVEVAETELDRIVLHVGAQNGNLRSGDVWAVNALIAFDDGRRFLRSFKIKIAPSLNEALAAAQSVSNVTNFVQQAGVIIVGAAEAVPQTPTIGVYTLTPPPDAGYAEVQFHTDGVYTLDGATPSDATGIGVQVEETCRIVLETTNEVHAFRFTGTNAGADAVQVYVTYYTADPTPNA